MKVTFDDDHHRLIVNGRVPPLSRKEYELIRLLYAHYEEYNAGKCESCYVSADLLTGRIGTKSRPAFYQLVSSSRLKLAPFTFEIISRWKQGYAIIPPKAG